MKREALVVARLFTEIYLSSLFFVLGIRFDIPTCRCYLHTMRIGLDAHSATQTSDWHSAARSRKGFSKPVPGFVTELTILSDWGMVGFGAWESRSSCGKTKAKCTLGGKREVAGNQSSPGTTNCRAQAQVFRTNRRRFPLLSVWLWCDPSTKNTFHGFKRVTSVTQAWQRLGLKKKKKKMKQVGSPRGKKK